MRNGIIAQIKNSIDVKELFQRHYPRHFRAYGNSLCPFHKDTNGSLSFRNGGFKCFADKCGARGDVIDLYQRIHRCDFREALRGLQAEAGLTSNKGPQEVAVQKEPLLKVEKIRRSDFAQRYDLLLRAGLIPHEAVEYLTKQRCLSEELIERLEHDEMVTWLDDDYTQAIVFPVFDTADPGEMVGYQKIPIFGGEKRFAKNADGKTAVFNYGQSGPVVVTESILDGLSAMECVECSMLSIMSSSGTDKLVHHKGKDLVLFLDNDDSGRSATQKAVKVLGRQCRVVDWSLAPNGFNDVNDLLKAGHRDIIRKMILEARTPAGLDPDILDQNYIEEFKFPQLVELIENGSYFDIVSGIDALRTYISITGNKLARSTAGLGKTSNAVDQAYVQAIERIVHYFLPNHMICQEVTEKLLASNRHELPIVHLMGRASDGRNGSRIVCSMYSQASAVMKKGYDPGAVLCPKCRSKKNCKHALQLARINNEERGLIIAPHAYIPIHLAPPNDEETLEKVGYVDENPLEVMLHPSEPCSIEDFNILRPYVTSDCTRFFDLLQQLIHTVHTDLVSKKKKIARYYTEISPVALWKDRLSLWDALGITKEEAVNLCGDALTHLETMPVACLYERDIPLIAINWLKAALGEAVAYLEIRDNGKAVFVNMVKEKVDPEAKIILLDATIDYDEAGYIFDREFDTLDINVPWAGRRIHLETGMGITKTKDMQKNKDVAQLTQALETAAYYLDNPQNLYLATYKHHERQCGQIMRKILPSTTVLTGHYGAIRSSNKYENCDSAVLFGTLRIPPDARLDAAAMIFPDDPARQEQWMLHKQYEEPYQNAHRLRLIRNPGRTLIIVDREWPAYLLGEPDVVIPIKSTKTKIGKAVERALKFISEHFELSKEDCVTIGVGSREDEIKIRRERSSCYGDDLLLFSDANWWTALSHAVLERNPDIEVTSLRSKHGKPCKVLHIQRM